MNTWTDCPRDDLDDDEDFCPQCGEHPFNCECGLSPYMERDEGTEIAMLSHQRKEAPPEMPET